MHRRKCRKVRQEHFLIHKKKDGVYGENNFRRTEKDNIPVYL